MPVNRWSPSRALLTVAASVALWAVIAGLCLLVGSTGHIGFPTQFSYRLEVVLLASLIGAALSSAGVAYQAILRNPLADPFLLGVSSGASLFGYIWQFGFATAILNRFGGESGAALSQLDSGWIIGLICSSRSVIESALS